MTIETTAQTLAEIRPGSVIDGRYTIEGELGAGGFATVFSAFDREIERQVAIKVLNLAAMGGGQNVDVQPFLERFRREARLAARIRHGNVVEIYDFGVLGTRSNPYMVMEMLDGHDLQDEIDKGGGMPPSRALPLFCGALDALGEAHLLGIVHKDLKPANLFINRPGTRHEILKVVDFGIAHIGESSESRMTQTGAMFGTPQYLPPEYIQTQVVTPGMDVYQMGLILVELLTGRPVVNEDNPWQCAVKHVTREIDIPVELLDGVLGPILRRALEYEPEDRYATAAQFGDALSEIDPAQVGDVRSPNTPYRKIDNSSGQFVPIARPEDIVAAQDTAAMLQPPVAQTLGISGGLDSLGAPRPPAHVAVNDNSETLVSWEDAEPDQGSNKKLWLVLILLLFLVIGAGVLVALFGPGSGDGATDSTVGEEKLIAEPTEAKATPEPGEILGADALKDPVAQPTNIGEKDPQPAVAAEPLGADHGVGADTAKTQQDEPAKVVEKPKPAPATTNKPRDTKQNTVKPKDTRPKTITKVERPPVKTVTPKPKPPVIKEEPPKKNTGMLLAPELEPSMDLAP
ncbi:serine/threonine protein kinase [Bradymonas sediminis]|uniref:Uncharacterized protein n=1 Tax=Bradymonas sediminis TaxID=1548548 RepID=A0A2Z4FI37_9DELT|nr:serine/threonine-protein kinase [Bradymonas sediminis]AWV88465.1 hypothetical protein DN745_03520 [Bradymonas sediminis]TDP77593.1 serine/threonine protein kinase [Bradymonas sediminis]